MGFWVKNQNIYLKWFEISVIEHMPFESGFHSKLFPTLSALKALLMAMVCCLMTEKGFLITEIFSTNITDGIALPPLSLMLINMAGKKIINEKTLSKLSLFLGNRYVVRVRTLNRSTLM